MPYTIDKNSVMGEMEGVLKQLSRKGLIDFLTQSCHVAYDASMETAPMKDLIDWVLYVTYGAEAFNIYCKETRDE